MNLYFHSLLFSSLRCLSLFVALFVTLLATSGAVSAKSNCTHGVATNRGSAVNHAAAANVSRFRFVSCALQTDTSITISQSYRTAPRNLLEIDLSVPLKVVVTGSKKKQLELKLTLKGRSLQAGSVQKANKITIQARKTQAGGYVSSGVLTVEVPDSLLTSIKLTQGQILVGKLTGSLAATLQQGDLKLTDVSATCRLQVGQGSISTQNSQLQGSLGVYSGLVQLSKTQGDFAVFGPGGSFTVSSRKDIEALVQKGQMDLKVDGANVSAQAKDCLFNFQWKSDKKAAGHQLDFQVLNSSLNLDLPEGFSMDLNLDQNQTQAFLAASQPVPTGQPTGPERGKGKKMKLDSEFALTAPTEKEITHQGKKMKVAQGRQLLDGGANKVTIHATDSEVRFRKIKAVTK